jgi:ring-1,2-phenylacetyl-CoA epoxidase subunit PaaD
MVTPEMPQKPPLTAEDVLDILREVEDPEIPVLNVVDMGVVRNIRVSEDEVEVDITPTYSGCPAMKTIEEDIREALKEQNFGKVSVNTILYPAWTTDWLTESAREKLRLYGIAPPAKTSADKSAILGQSKSVACPHCGSHNTSMISQFGSTACKALWKCEDCLEPFDYFKCI